MNSLFIVGCPSAAVVLQEALRTGQSVPAAIATSPHASRAMAALPAAFRPRQVFQSDDQNLSERLRELTMDSVVNMDSVVYVFAGPPVPAPALEHLPTLHVEGAGRADGLPGDPVARAILDGDQLLSVYCRGETGARTVWNEDIRLRLDDNAETIAIELAKRVTALLDRWDDQPATEETGQSRPVPPPLMTPPGAWPVEWDELDWTRPATSLLNLVRASSLPGHAAWTWLGEVRLGVGLARADAETAGGVPPGTVIHNTADCLVVTTGEGSLRISAIRDLIGPVDPADIPVGSRLGICPGTELAQIRHRLLDLEHTVAELAARADLLGPQATAEARI